MQAFLFQPVPFILDHIMSGIITLLIIFIITYCKKYLKSSIRAEIASVVERNATAVLCLFWLFSVLQLLILLPIDVSRNAAVDRYLKDAREGLHHN